MRPKDILAVLIALASLAGLYFMWTWEPGSLDKTTMLAYQREILPNLRNYALAMGLILLVVSVSYILLGSENEIETSLDEPDRK